MLAVCLCCFYTIRYTIEHPVIDQSTEHFKLIARNKGLKHRKYQLKILEGATEVWNMAFLQKIYEQIEELVEMYLEKQ